MRKWKLATKLLAMTMVFTTAFSLTGCKNTKPAAEQITEITEAFKSGDSELFYASMEESKKFDSYFEAVQNKSTSGLGAVYVKLNEKAKDVTVQPDEKNDTFDIPVTVSSYDAYTVALTKMYEAAKEGPEAFADMPAWLTSALDEAEMTTESVEFDSRTDSTTLKYEFGSNSDFFKKMTCGLYDFMNATMTTCTDGEITTCLLAKGDEVLFSADYYYTPLEELEEYGFSEDTVQDYIDEMIKEYEGYEGVLTDAQYDGKGISQVIFVDYNTVSASTLVDLGFLSSSAADGITLKGTIEGFEKDGMTCVTETFGITSEEEVEE